MSSTLCVTTEVALDNYALQMDNMSVEDSYATAPIVAIQPFYQRLDEEELYTSFEEAISDRLVALRGRLDRISTQQLQYNTDPVVSFPTACKIPEEVMPLPALPHSAVGPLFNEWQQVVMFVSLALMCMMIGFDLMGLLVLHMR